MNKFKNILKLLSQNIGISFTNLLFIGELSLLLFFKNFNFSKLNINLSTFRDITYKVYTFLYSINVLLWNCKIVCVNRSFS